ncbi:MAG: efflux RND transporter periplasmic adaptor subunit [Bacteroidota bacterium]
MMNYPTKKQIGIAVGGILIVLAVVWGFWPKPIEVAVKPVQRGPLEVTIEEEGITRVQERYQLAAPVTGYMMRLDGEHGDTLRAGQSIALLQPAPDMISARQKDIALSQYQAAKIRVQQTEEQLRVAKEEWEVAQRELQRLEDLYIAQIGTQQQIEWAELRAHQAEVQFRSAQFALTIARYERNAAETALATFRKPNQQESIVIESPVEGQILSIHQKNEGVIQAGSPIMEIGALQSLEIRSDVLSTDAVRIDQGTEVRIKRWGSDHVLAGSVRRVDPSGYTRISALGVEEQRVPVIIDIMAPRDQWQSLGDGFRVVAEYIIWQGEDVVQVPSSALFRVADQWALFIQDGNRAQLQYVTIGQQSGLYTQIIEGIRAGDQILTHPDERIEDGTRIRARK